MHKKLLILILVTPVFINCSGQNLITNSKKTNTYFSKQISITKIVNQISQYGKVESQSIGYTGRSSEQYSRFSQLMINASDSELVLLINHYSPVVKAYAFWALVIKEYPELKGIIEKHLQNRQSFQFQSGCIIETKKINEWFLSFGQQYLTKEEFENYRLLIHNNSK